MPVGTRVPRRNEAEVGEHRHHDLRYPAIRLVGGAFNNSLPPTIASNPTARKQSTAPKPRESMYSCQSGATLAPIPPVNAHQRHSKMSKPLLINGTDATNTGRDVTPFGVT